MPQTRRAWIATCDGTAQRQYAVKIVYAIRWEAICRTPDFARAASISSTIRAGLIGASLILMPNGASAFSTEPMMAAIDAMVPPSPAPLRPSGLSGEAVSVWRIVIGGISVADGNRYSP